MKLFSIFGNPVSHSKSPLMHNCVFKNLNFNACYTRTNLEDSSKLRETFLNLGLFGANITVPHKEDAYKACDEVRGFAKKIKVVNTIIKEDEKLIGYNTDADGFIYAIEEFGKVESILIIGAGGTAKALANKFIQDKIEVNILNRSKKRLEYFKGVDCDISTWEDYKKDKKYTLVVNTTSAGLSDNELPAPFLLVDNILDNSSFVADVIYGKETPFLKLAKSKNKILKDGTDMLIGQGVLANYLFTEQRFSKKDIKTYMKKSFQL